MGEGAGGGRVVGGGAGGGSCDEARGLERITDVRDPGAGAIGVTAAAAAYGCTEGAAEWREREDDSGERLV